MDRAAKGRWPSICDADDLSRQIDKAALDLRTVQFYDLILREDPLLCCGDVLQLDCPVPTIDGDGEPVISDGSGLWLAIGNTCDFDRDRSQVIWTQVVPLEPVTADSGRVSELLLYKAYRRFYLPPWPSHNRSYLADFLRPVALHRDAIGRKATVVARMTMPAWVLLHSCLIRFIARDDGRFD